MIFFVNVFLFVLRTKQYKLTQTHIHLHTCEYHMPKSHFVVHLNGQIKRNCDNDNTFFCPFVLMMILFSMLNVCVQREMREEKNEQFAICKKICKINQARVVTQIARMNEHSTLLSTYILRRQVVISFSLNIYMVKISVWMSVYVSTKKTTASFKLCLCAREWVCVCLSIYLSLYSAYKHIHRDARSYKTYSSNLCFLELVFLSLVFLFNLFVFCQLSACYSHR